MRVSRDGARVGVVAGVGEARRLLVGRVAERRGRLRIVDVRSVAPGVKDVRDLTWDSATSLVVLGVTATAGVAVPIRVAVDGSSVALVNRVGLEGSQPLTIAAAPGQPLVVGARFAGVLSLFTASSVTPQYVRERGITGADPFYAG
jgi:hypothetical protein